MEKALYYNIGNKIKGKYYLSDFSGTIVGRRFHTINTEQIIYDIDFDSPTDIRITKDQEKADFRDSVLIIANIYGDFLGDYFFEVIK